MELPVSELTTDYRKLLLSLTVDNPAYKTASFFGKGFVSKSIPQKLFFFKTDDLEQTILVPRGIDPSYIKKLPEINNLAYGESIGMGHNGDFKLRPNQQEFFDGSVLPYIDNIDNNTPIDILLNAECGSGKCHAKGTKILMYDGSLKNVEDIKVGELLMGDDSTPRKILSLATGTEEMYKILQRDGIDYIVNKSHILSLQLREWGAGSGSSRGQKSIDNYGKVINISIADYLKLPHTKQGWLYGYSKPALYTEKEVLLDPYFLGVWLGDGNSREVSITTDGRDAELVKYYKETAQKFNLQVREEYNSENSNNYHLTHNKRGVKNPIKEILKHYNLILNKHIPNDYIVNSIESRLKLLAGLIDTDGYVDKKSYGITLKSLLLSNDIKRLCWSLGFRVIHSVKMVKGVSYQRLTIKGNNLYDIPVKLDRKKVEKRTTNKDASITSFKVEPVGIGEYYGFTIDGNNLYQLEDGTVTHNTIMALYLASEYQVRTIVAVTTKKIGEQFKKAVADLFPNWSCGWEDGKKEYDITLSTYSLLSKENYTEEYFSKFGHIILDEYHRCGADTYQKILEKASCRCRTSLTATFRRKDGLHKILKLHAGHILEMEKNSMSATIYPISTGIEINEDLFRGVDRFSLKFKNLEEYADVCIRNLKGKELDRGTVTKISLEEPALYLMSSVSHKEVKFLDPDTNNKIFKLGNVSAPMLDTEIADNTHRTDLVFDLIRELYLKNRKIIVLSKRKEQLYLLAGKFKRRGIFAGVFVSDKDKDYKEFCERQGKTVKEYVDYIFNDSRIILGIDKLAEEGMDAPSFDTLVYLHPMKDIEQSVGRILREYENKQPPIAFYLVDKVNSYNKSFYGKTAGAKGMFQKLGHIVKNEISISEATEQIKNGVI